MQSDAPQSARPGPAKPARVALVVTSTLVVRWFLLDTYASWRGLMR